ncbi:MAG: heavy metal translocating P-type ATPase [Acidimicrobiaceae bacterium]|nr:heavy metal translocating P-type ATPase [Acidimicrobiaceae bacterium]
MSERQRNVRDWRSKFAVFALPIGVTAGLSVGAIIWLTGSLRGAHIAWFLAAVVGVVYSFVAMVNELRRGRFGVDPLALLSLGGALFVREFLAAAIISVMFASGHALDQWASRRARREIASLMVRVPKTAHLLHGDEMLTVDLASVVVGDLVVVTSGEMVPVDGNMTSTSAVLDESALTGESLPVERARGELVRSGALNAGPPFEMRAIASAEESTYSGIIRLVAGAESASVPFVRMADRYSQWFVAVSLALAGFAWIVGGLSRAVAVLVVATPCPLILAVPVALVSGLSRSAHLGIIVKNGAVLERLARVSTLLIDKTGTITRGRPVLNEIAVAADFTSQDVLLLAASLDQLSPHVLARSIVQSALGRGLELEMPTLVEEEAGQGIRGRIAGQMVTVGKAAWCGAREDPTWAFSARRRAQLDGALTVFVGVQGEPVGVLVFDDPIRPDVERTMRRLRRRGIGRIAMVTGDRLEVAETVRSIIGVDEVFAERSPQEKLDIVRDESLRSSTMMVGDGINDAPALALADVGVAMGSRAATAASEAADVILTSDRLDRLDDALAIAKKSLRVARQSMVTGIALSLVAMIFALVGWLPAVWGAILQELIDVAVILNSLRALVSENDTPHLNAKDIAVTAHFRLEHASLRDSIEEIHNAADSLGSMQPAETLRAVQTIYEMLTQEIQPHEEEEEKILYPLLARLMGGREPLGAMSHAHREIIHQIRRLGQVVGALRADHLDDAEVLELRSLLYGLYFIVKLHTAQEDENYLYLDDSQIPGERSAPSR